MTAAIKTRRQYKVALKRIDELMNAEARTQEAAELETLAIAVEAYERKRFASAPPVA